MTLNFSHHPIFPAHLAEDNLVSPMRIANGYLLEGIPERSIEGYARQWQSSMEVQDLFDYEGDNMEWEKKLPADPFGMNITAITGLFCGRSEVGAGKDDSSLLAEFNYMFNKAIDFHTCPENTKVDDETLAVSHDRCFLEETEHLFYDGCVGIACAIEGVDLDDDNISIDLIENHYENEITVVEETEHPFYDGGVDFACAIEGVHLDDDNISIDLIENHYENEITAVEETEHPFYDGGVDFACAIEGVNLDDDNISIDLNENHYENDITAVEETEHPFYDGGVDFAFAIEGVNLDDDNISIDLNENHYVNKITAVADDPHDGAPPHPALSFALGYLGVRDLLSVERVCKSLRFSVQSDPLLWKSIHIDPSLNDRVTDGILLQLTSRAQGNLQCLSLVECQRVTDDGLKRVLESNMRLSKLSVPGCTRLSIDGIVSCLRAFKMVATTGIKYLRIGGLYGVKQDHFEELMSLLGVPNHIRANYPKPHFYYRGNFYLSCEDGRPIDIEMCPRCQSFKLVYDCPAESCKGEGHATTQSCRACTICVPRCAQCGKCINDGQYEETFCLELLCFQCSKQLLICQVEQDIVLSSSKTVSSSFNG